MAAMQDDVPIFALVVVNYGSSSLLEKNLAGIDVQGSGGVAIVVDNYTSDDERERVTQLASKYGWVEVQLSCNDGFGGGMNAGAAKAFELGASVIVALNPDATINKSSLRGLVDAVVQTPSLMLAPEIHTSSGSVWFDGMRLYLQSGRVASGRRRKEPKGPSVPWITGACFALSREMWLQVGGFDPRYFLYWEDIDLSRRVVLAGGYLEVNKNLRAVHDEGGTQLGKGSRVAKSEIYYYYNIRNRLYFAAQHLDRLHALRWLIRTPVVSYEILLGGGRRQFFESLAPWRAYVRGTIAGVRYVISATRRSPS